MKEIEVLQVFLKAYCAVCFRKGNIMNIKSRMISFSTLTAMIVSVIAFNAGTGIDVNAAFEKTL